MNVSIQRLNRMKIGFLVVAIIINVVMTIAMNPITVEKLFSNDQELGQNLSTSLLLISIFLLSASFFLTLNIVLLKNNYCRIPNATINVILIIYSVSSVIIFAEVLLRVINPAWIPKQIYSYNQYFDMTWHKPNLDVNFRTSEYNVNFRTNSIGLRDENELTCKQDNEIRILFFGDSFIQAAQVDQEHTMCHIVEKKLNLLDRNTKFRVINLGTSGCGPDYERKFLEKNLNLLEADHLLLFVYVGNDIITERSFRETKTSRICGMWNSLINNGTRFSFLLRFIFQERNEFPMGRPCQPFDGETWERSANIFLKKYNAKILDAYSRLFEELSAIKMLCNEKNLGLYVFLIPTKEQVDRSKLDEVLKFFKIEEETLDMNKPQQIISDFLARIGVVSFDLLPCLLTHENEEKKYFEIDSHWNIHGNQTVADTVFGALKKTIIKA